MSELIPLTFVKDFDYWVPESCIEYKVYYFIKGYDRFIMLISPDLSEFADERAEQMAAQTGFTLTGFADTAADHNFNLSESERINAEEEESQYQYSLFPG